MKCYQRNTKIKTFAGKQNALRDQTEEQLLLLGMQIGIRLTMLATNRLHSISNERLKSIYYEVNRMWFDEMKIDPELGSEILMAELNKLMGKNWDKGE